MRVLNSVVELQIISKMYVCLATGIFDCGTTYTYLPSQHTLPWNLVTSRAYAVHMSVLLALLRSYEWRSCDVGFVNVGLQLSRLSRPPHAFWSSPQFHNWTEYRGADTLIERNYGNMGALVRIQELTLGIGTGGLEVSVRGRSGRRAVHTNGGQEYQMNSVRSSKYKARGLVQQLGFRKTPNPRSLKCEGHERVPFCNTATKYYISKFQNFISKQALVV
jgi:hypothetical protein